MNLSQYAEYDGLALADLIREKEVSPTELMQLAIEAVEKVNPQINAVIEVYEDALEIAEQIIHTTGSFYGVPFLRKDIGAAEAGRLQEMGSRLYKGHIPEHDSYLMTRFKAAGLATFGRTTVPELGIAGQTETILQGITCNPWNLKRMTGGSSGGAAASVAAGIVPVAHASDGAGSIRIPASCCGLVGLNPSRGRVSMGPDNQDKMFGLVRELVVSRSVRDTAAMLDAVQGAGVGDPFIIVKPERPYIDEMAIPTGRLRIAWTAQPWYHHPVHPEIAAAVEKVAAICEDMGHQVEEASPPVDHEAVDCIVMNLFGMAGSDTADHAAELGRALSIDYLEPATLKIIERAKNIKLAEVTASFEAMRMARLVIGQFFETYDLLITPTLVQLPQPHGLHSTKRDDLEANEYWENDLKIFQHLGLFNVSGTPSISLPLGHSESGLPIGVQFAAGFAREDLLIRIARDFEDAMPWKDRKPAVHVSQ